MSEASITALALEESLLKEWSEFHARVEERPAAAVTRAQADEFLDYSRKGPFVDSVVDALSLYLAGRSDFDSKFGSYLELMLIQRAHDEDIAVLPKLAARYAADGNLVSLMGLLQRLRLYSGDERLGPVIETCVSALRQFDTATDTPTWAKTVGIEPGSENWSVGLRLGTALPNYWLIRKDELKPADVSLEFLASAREWRVQVARVDRAYSAQWRSAGISVATEEVRFKSPSAWPTLRGQAMFPMFALNLADFLQVQWTRTVWLSGKDVEIDKGRLLEWLHACVDEVKP